MQIIALVHTVYCATRNTITELPKYVSGSFLRYLFMHLAGAKMVLHEASKKYICTASC